VPVRYEAGERSTVVTVIEGSAWSTDEHTFLCDVDDRLKAGFRL
jgi:proline racemase